jgi:hypothetical protein
MEYKNYEKEHLSNTFALAQLEDLSTCSLDELKLIQSKMNFLCEAYDPFTSTEDAEVKAVIEQLNLQNLLDNPFSFTNKLLQLLDQLDNELRLRNV